MKQRTTAQKNIIQKAKGLYSKLSEQKIEEALEKNNWDWNQVVKNLAENGEQGNPQIPFGISLENQQFIKQNFSQNPPPPQKSFSELENKLKSIPQNMWYSDIADQILKMQEIEDQQLETNLNNRVISSPVGVKNVNNQSFFSCVIVILLQNPDLIQRILDYKPIAADDEFTLSQQKFMKELNCLVVRYILTTQRYVDPQALFSATQDYLAKCQINIEGETLPEFYDKMLKCIDLGLEHKKDNQEQSLNVLSTQYCSKQQLKQEEECMTYIKINPSDNFLYCTLIKKISDERKFKQLPKNLAFNIRRTVIDQRQNITTHVNSDFWFPKTINLDFLVGDKKCDEIMKYLEKSSNEVKNIQNWQDMYNDITIVLSIYEQQTIIPSDVIRSLKQEQQGIYEKLKIVFPRNLDQFNHVQNISQSSEYTYSLSLIGIQILKNQVKQYYLYVYNFNTNQWFLHNGKQTRQAAEHIVMNDAIKNACFIMYVTKKQQEMIQSYQKQLQEIEQKIQISRGQLPKEDYEDSLLKKIPTEYKTLIEVENKEFMHQ